MPDTVISPDRAELDNLLCHQAVNDPAGYYGRVRDVDPVYWNQRWNGWILTGYDQVISAYRDHARLSSDRFAGPFGEDLSAASSKYQNLFGFLSKFFVWKDQPYHTRVRGLVNKAFTPRSVEVIRPQVQELIRSLVQPMAGERDVDFFSRFAFTLPVIVIAEYLGVPPEGRNQVREWAEDLGAVIFVSGNDENRMEKGEAAMTALVEFLRPVIRDKRTNPKDDLLSGMVQAEERGDFLSEDEVIANAVLMVFAGHETTMNFLANGMVAFSRNPEQWRRLRDDPSLSASAAEEVLRFDGPIRAMARWAKEPFELGGHDIAQGDRLLLVQYAANHDPAGFPNPQRFDIGRQPNRHAAFGQGIHTCLGAPLARLEAQEAFSALASAFPSFEISETEFEYVPNLISRSLKQLHVTFHSS